MLACNVPRMSRKTIGTEHLAAYWSDEFSVFAIIAKPKQAEKPALSFLAGSYCGCHESVCRDLSRGSLVGAGENERPRRMGVELSVLVGEPSFRCR